MNKSLKIHGALLGATLIYGSTYSIAKFVMDGYLGSSGFILIRAVTATSLYFLFHALFVKEKIREFKDYRDLFICGLFGVATNMLLFFKGLNATVEINASVLMLNAPIFVLIFSFFMLKDGIRKQQVVGMLIAALGAVLLIGGRSFEFNSAHAKGDAMVILNAISFAFFLVYVKRLLRKYHVITIAKFTFLFGTLLIIPFGIPDIAEASFSSFTPRVWLAIAFVSVFTTFIAYLFNSWAVQKASPALVSSYIYLQPVVATLIAGFYGQALSFEKLIFALLIIAGVFIVTKKRK